MSNLNNMKMEKINQKIAELEQIFNSAKITKALPLKEDFERESGIIECPLCRAEENELDYSIAEFETHYESITAGIQCFGYGEQLDATERLINSIPEMFSLIKQMQSILKNKE